MKSGQWNPRYLAYCRAHGISDPDAMLDHDNERWPGGCMCGFILWIQARWNEFDQFTGISHKSETGVQQEYHDTFDLWLNLKGANNA